jgi:hypothetical protein
VVGISFLQYPPVPGIWKIRKQRTVNSGYLKVFRIKELLDLGIWKKKIRFKNLPVLGISKTSKNHQVSWKKQQRPGDFR